MTDVYDIGLLGAGPGGIAVVEEARKRGLSVVCLDTRKLAGGTCLHEGCIPSKALLHASYLYEQTSKNWGGDWGIKAASVKLDIKAMMARKQTIVDRLARGADSLMQGRIKYVCAQGRIDKDAQGGLSLVANKKDRFRVKHVIIATGSVATSLPFLPLDNEGVVESRGGLSFKSVPRHLAVVGGGYIGLELGSVWRRLGAHVSIIEQMDDIVMTMDADVRAALRRALEQQGLTMHLKTTVQGYDKAKGGYRLKVTDKQGKANTLDVSHILVAVGRKPCCEGIGLEELGVTRDERGFIVVDDKMATNVAGVSAIGDVVGGLMLAHKADSEARIAVGALNGETPESLSQQHIPCIVYTHPEVACVGMSEDALKADNKTYGKGVAHFRANGRAVAMGHDEGFVKVLRDERDTLVGVHMVGAEVGTVLAEAVATLRFSASCQDVATQCQAHPTLNEALTRAAATARL